MGRPRTCSPEKRRADLAAAARRYYARHTEEILQANKTPASRMARNKVSREWSARNRAQAAAATRLWHDDNPGKCAEYNQKRKAAKRQAVPAWADHDLIADIYAYARIMRDHGVDCHVDHEVPLRGKLVSGLHTHDNLTVLLATDNLRKGNRHG